MKKGQNNKIWGVPGKIQKLYTPAHFQSARILPLNDNPLDAWDTKKSKYIRRDLIPREQQMDGINESSAAPVVSPTPSPTPSITPTITPTPSITPTMTQTVTPTPSITPSSSPAAFDADAAAYLSAVSSNGGTLNSTISAATDTLFTSLKSNGLYTKLYTFYPILGGVAAAHSLNGKRSMGTTYDMTFNGGWTHNSNGALANGTNGYADTKFSPGAETTISALTWGYYNTATSNVSGEYYNGSLFNTSPQVWSSNRTQGALGTRVDFGTDTRANIPNVANQSGLYMVVGGYPTGRVSYCYNGTFASGNTFGAVTSLPNFNHYMGCLNLSGTAYGFIPFRYTFWFNAKVALTNTELITLSNIINTFETTLSRNTF